MTTETQTSLFQTGFKDARFLSATKKEQVLRAWERFLKNGCQPQDFTEALYEHLIQHCSFIAHYDRRGFYGTYFREGADTAHFLTQFDRARGCNSVEYGYDGWLHAPDYADINNAMVDVAAKYIPELTKQARNRQRQADIARAKALLAKHEIDLEVKE